MPDKKKEIFNPKEMADSLRHTEYKHFESAVSEIIDNSIEANADEIYVIVKSDLKDGRKRVSEVMFLDNGDGMDPDTLQSALSLGEGTRKDRKGIGRFGVGLKQASFYACPRLEIYSWQDSEKVYYCDLDVRKMKSGEQTYIDYPSIKKPNHGDYWLFYNQTKFRHGTMVLWKDLDNAPVKTASSLVNRLDKELGRVFRYFLLKERVRIYLIDLENPSTKTKVLPRDPLFLMKRDFFKADSKLLGEKATSDSGEPVFEPFVPEGYDSHVITLDVEYYNQMGTKMTAPVDVKFSLVKEKFYSGLVEKYNNPGNSPIGKYVKKYMGVSIVRSEREIDFGRFDFYESENQPVHRWWGVEISFDSRLDEVFNVSNNKQHVELKKPPKSEIHEAQEEDEKPLWIQLNEVIEPAIKSMLKKNEERRKGTRKKHKKETPSRSEKPQKTISNEQKDQDSPDDIIEARAKQAVSEAASMPSSIDDDVDYEKKLPKGWSEFIAVDEDLNKPVDILYDKGKIKFILSEDVAEVVLHSKDSRTKHMLHVLIEALVRASNQEEQPQRLFKFLKYFLQEANTKFDVYYEGGKTWKS